MEYGEAISDDADEAAFQAALQQLARGRVDLHEIASEAVARTYCVCVVDGEDAAEGHLSAIHAKLIESLERRLRAWVYRQEIV
ncbi:MAG TPA: hypothetical protein VF027_04040 [Sphingomicrobium sp.]